MTNLKANFYISIFLQVILLFNIVFARFVIMDDWHNPNRIQKLYERCSANKNGIRCKGIPANCIVLRNCDYAIGYWEEDENFLVTINGPNQGNEKPYIAAGTNLAARCKSELTLEDFRVIFYKMTTSEIGDGIINNGLSESGTQGFGKENTGPNGTCWRKETQEYFNHLLKRYNYGSTLYSLILSDRQFLILNGQHVSLEYHAHPIVTPLMRLREQFPGFFNSTHYTSVDGIVFTNF